MKVFELNKALPHKGVWYPTGGSQGQLFATLDRAQSQVVDAGPWVKRERRRQWETKRMDIITERKVQP